MTSRILTFFTAASVAVALSVSAAPPDGKGPGGGGGGGGKPGSGDGGTTVDHKARQDAPIQLGTSGGSVVDLANGYCCSGTLGSLLEDTNGKQYILSNTHVLAGDSASGGNGLLATVGDAINQPGFIDVQCQNIPNDYVANLSAWITLTPGGSAPADAAIAEVIPGMVDSTGAILEIGTISSTVAAPVLNTGVKKSGRTSGLTTGTIASLDATINVGYSDECAGNDYVTTFTGQIIVTPGKFIQGGDSGSLMVENVSNNPRPIGLLFAGSKRVAVANPIQDVLDELSLAIGSELSFVGTASAGAAPAASSGFSSANGLAAASAAKARNAATLMAVPGAIGHGIGNSNGIPTIQVLVTEITPGARAALPAAVEGFRVELLEVGEVIAL